VVGLSPDELRERIIETAQRILVEAGVSPEKTTFQVRKVMSEAAVTGGQIATWLRSLAEEEIHQGEKSDQILSCTAVGAAIYLGLGDAGTNLSHRMGGAVHYDMSRFPVSRAGAKLAEAFEAFPLAQIPLPARAIDLGAAPGGWTGVLLEHGFHVDAIDPGELHPSIASHPQVTAHRVKAQDWRPKMGGYQLLTCDVNWSAKETALAVVDLARHVAVGGFGVVTIKLNKGPAMPQIEAVKTILESRFRVEAVRLLFHNRREVTLFLRRH
jgi:23S rRNA (cytidine2498-2'-O)-methyltransferase